MKDENGLRIAFKKGMAFGLGLVLVLSLAFTGFLFAQSLTNFSSGSVVSASAMNANFSGLKSRMDSVEAAGIAATAALNARVAPIGGIIAWHNTIGGVPALPAGWVLCDGNPIADPDSPLNGQTTPNLIGAPNGWNAGGYYLRGAAAAGGTQVDTFQGHRHNRNPTGALEHDMTQSAGALALAAFGAFHALDQTITGDPVTGLSGGVRVGNETRPVSFLVVWIMRIK